MRVISGRNKGRKLAAPRGMSTRPTSDRVREALFNIIATQINGSSFLDLYAGSGAVGIEAEGRGAEKVVFVENNRSALSVLRNNIRLAGVDARVMATSVARSIDILADEGACFDLIFSDPPYREGAAALKPAARIAQKNLLHEDGLFILEFGISHFQPVSADGLDLFDHRRYGDTGLAFYRPSAVYKM